MQTDNGQEDMRLRYAHVRVRCTNMDTGAQSECEVPQWDANRMVSLMSEMRQDDQRFIIEIYDAG